MPSAHGPLSALRATPGDATGIPRFAPVREAATLVRTCNRVLFLPVRPWTPFGPAGHLPRARGRLRDLLRSFSIEAQEPERRDVFRLEAHSDCPEGWGPIRKALCAGCQNAAAGGELPLLLAACWGTFSCALKPEYIPQRLPPHLPASWRTGVVQAPRVSHCRRVARRGPRGQSRLQG